MLSFKKHYSCITIFLLISLIVLMSGIFLNSVNSFCEEDYDDCAHKNNISLIKDTFINNEKDEVQSILSDYGIILKEIKTVESHDNEGQISTYYLKPDSFKLSIILAEKYISGQNYLYVTAIVDPKINEVFAGPLDYISIEWNPNKGEYYKSYADEDNNIISKADGSRVKDGIMLFNLDDHKIFDWTVPSCAVVLKNHQKGLLCGTKFTHTYTTLGAGSASFEFTDSRDTELRTTFKLNLSKYTYQWTLWEDIVYE